MGALAFVGAWAFNVVAVLAVVVAFVPVAGKEGFIPSRAELGVDASAVARLTKGSKGISAVTSSR